MMKSNLARKAMQDTVTEESMHIVIVGHVDHGKSTFIGRLLHDTDSLPEGKYEHILRASSERGMPFEWSFLTDALQAERDQGITIDISHIGFKTRKRNYVIIDAPGHKEFLKNMISGAAASDAAILIIDAKEGIKEQSRRHGYLLQMLGIRQIAVLVSKMDAIGFDEKRFSAVKKEYCHYLEAIGIVPTFIIPISAREGDNLVARSVHMPWYKGPTVTAALDDFESSPSLTALPLRLSIQDIYKFDERRILAGRIESGTLKLGDELLFSPTGARARIATIESWNEKNTPQNASVGESIGITLDNPIFIERGHIASHVENAPSLTNLFRARLFWLGHNPLETGKRYRLKIGTHDIMAEVKEIEQVIDTDTLTGSTATSVERGGIAEVIWRTQGVVAVDAINHNPKTGRFVIIENHDIRGGGIIDLKGFPDQRVYLRTTKSKNLTAVDLQVSPQQRALVNGHQGGILWFTGFSGSGKSTLAVELERQLFAKGCHVYVLDGDNIRSGLNKDLGFSPPDRSENIRRIGEVAALFAKAGLIVITAFISPYTEDRLRARAAAPEYFNLVHIKADLNICEKRDTKGLYKKARKGQIAEFTGVSAPYDDPVNPDLVIDTSIYTVDECVKQLIDYVKKQFIEPSIQ